MYMYIEQTGSEWIIRNDNITENILSSNAENQFSQSINIKKINKFDNLKIIFLM